MTDARLAAAVEAAARVRYERVVASWSTKPDSASWEQAAPWEQTMDATKRIYTTLVDQEQIEAALAAADAWDRERAPIEVPRDPIIVKVRGRRLSRRAAAQIRAVIQEAAQEPQVGDEGTGETWTCDHCGKTGDGRPELELTLYVKPGPRMRPACRA